MENQDELTGLLDDAGLAERHPEAVERARRETDIYRARLNTSRSLVYDSLSRMGLEGRSPALDNEVLALLPQTRELARSALVADPGSWQAPMLMGMSLYLERSLKQDRLLITDAPAWEKPLRAAVERADGHPETKRLLATAYLETWFALSAEKKQATLELLTEVFAEDLRSFEALLPVWLSLGLPLEQTFAVVPDRPSAWQSLAQGYAAGKRWERFVETHTRYLASLDRKLEEERQEAQMRMRLGDYFRSRSMFLKILVHAPPSGRFAPTVEKVLEEYPPGLHGLRATGQLQAWLDWILELGRLGYQPLKPELLGRLVDALGDLEPSKSALAAILAGDSYQAERFEKLARPLNLKTWAPYLIVKARKALAEGDVDTATAALADVTLSYRRRPTYAAVNLQLAKVSGEPKRSAEAEAAWNEVRKDEWSTLEWRWERERALLELVAERAADALELRIAEAPADGAVFEVSWNGDSVTTLVVRRAGPVRLKIPVTPGRIHLLELRPLAGGHIAPGTVRLLP